jgi:predicted secreted protein
VNPTMSVACIRCARINPGDAVFCYHDGQPLLDRAAKPVPAAPGFPSPLVLPSGRVCRNYDQLALTCQGDWGAGLELLQSGLLEQFLGGIGRTDLALAARAAADFPDRDRGLDQFLARLPTKVLKEPALQVGTAEIDLGTIRADVDCSAELWLCNRGGRLLHGTITSDSRWLAVGAGPATEHKLFQCVSEVCIPLQILSKKLRAGNKPLQGRLEIESNGGSATMVVNLIVAAVVFPRGALAGAATPRQLAEKARAFPKEAAELFENGSVAAWYRQNGWAYPVPGPPAAGLGGIQQFFEALGLAKPPLVEVVDPAITLGGYPGQILLYPLQLKTADRRPVYAHGGSNQKWVTVGVAEQSGSAATLPLRVTVPDMPGQRLESSVTVTANGGQRFEVPISLAVAHMPLSSAAAVTALPMDTAVLPPAGRPAKTPSAPKVPVAKPAFAANRCNPRPGCGWRHLLPLGPLVLLLLAVSLRDMVDEPPSPPIIVVVQEHPAEHHPALQIIEPIYKVSVKDEPPQFDEKLSVPPPVKVSIIDEKEEIPPVKPLPVKVEIRDEPDMPSFIAPNAEVDPKPRVLCRFGPLMRFGITAVETGKLLTYAFDGNTNQTMLRVNGETGEFGGPAGRFVERDFRLPPEPSRKAFGGSRSVWVSGKMQYTQLIELVPNKQPTTASGKSKFLIDTVRVQYIIENKDMRPMNVGLRCQVDTLIGGNDGVPFAIPGLSGMVTTFADFPRAGPIPDFIQALERPNLQNPGTVAHMSLKLGGDIEAPGRVSLTHWPGGTFPEWEVPLVPIQRDSAVVLYWADKAIKPGEKRVVGFAYGLGNVASTDLAGKLGITVDGSFEPGENFVLSTYVQNPVKGQTLGLELPPGLERVEGLATQQVPPPTPGAGTSIVTWKVRVLQTGTFPVKVASSNGLVTTKTISIARPEGAPEMRLNLDLTGSFEPGQEFTAVAKLTAGDPAPRDLPTLTLPEGLIATYGPSLKVQPQPDGKGTSSFATWKVKVVTPGTYAIRVGWAGPVVTKTLAIEQPLTTGGGYVAMRLDPPFEPRKAFSVTATVTDPLDGQTLSLLLPSGLRMVEGSETTPVVKSGEAKATASWKVLVEKPGSFPLRLHSSTGMLLKKTVVIEQSDNSGGAFALDYAGEIAPGKEFMVRATVSNPVPGQKLTLMPLPAGLELSDGPELKNVPVDPAGVSVVTWRLRVVDKGTLPVRVASSTGMVRAFTISLTAERPEEASPRIFGGKH